MPDTLNLLNIDRTARCPQVAVVTVCRNALNDLKLTLASVQSQTHQSILHIVIDGASSDTTPAFLRDHAALFHAAISEPDQGIYDAMNKAISLCPESAWVIFMNAGDRFSADDVLERVAPLLRPGVDMVFGSVAIRGDNGSERIFPLRRQARIEMPGCHQALLVRSTLLRELRFDTRYRVGADFDFFLRAMRRSSHLEFHDGVIAQIAPEGFSAANEHLLQRDYVDAISRHVGRRPALKWWVMRKLRRALLPCRDLLRRVGLA